MCKYSNHHPTVDPKHGQSLKIGKADAHSFWSSPVARGVFQVGDTAGSCACVKNGTKLTLTAIPESLQRKHRIGAHAIVTMIDKREYKEDKLQLSTGKRVRLIDFANLGITARVGVFEERKADTTAAVQQILGQAAAGAKNDGSATTTPTRELVDA